jgi:hypothetical protein
MDTHRAAVEADRLSGIYVQILVLARKRGFAFPEAGRAAVQEGLVATGAG